MAATPHLTSVALALMTVRVTAIVLLIEVIMIVILKAIAILMVTVIGILRMGTSIAIAIVLQQHKLQ